MFTQKTEKLLVGQDQEFIDMLESGILKRVEAKEKEEQAKSLKAEAEDLLVTSMTALGLDSASTSDHGSISMATDFERSSFSKKTMTEYLLEHGVAPVLLKEATEAATKKTPVPFQITYRAGSSD